MRAVGPDYLGLRPVGLELGLAPENRDMLPGLKLPPGPQIILQLPQFDVALDFLPLDAPVAAHAVNLQC